MRKAYWIATATAVAAVFAVAGNSYFRSHYIEATTLVKQAGVAPLPSLLQFLGFDALAAEEVGSSECNAKASDAQTAHGKIDSAYQHGALKYFRGMLLMAMKVMPSMAETSLCHFVKSMGMSFTDAQLPYTVSKTFGDSNTITLNVIAATAPYSYDGTVKKNDKTFMNLQWAGTGETSKGIMAMGPNGIGGDGGKGKAARRGADSNFASQKHGGYVKWDRGTDDQTMQGIMGAWTTSYLGATTDRAMFVKGSVNKTTSVFTIQAISIETRATALGCFRMFATGTLGGTVKVAKTNDALGTSGHALTATFKDATEMDGVQLPDKTTTANACQGTSADCSTVTDFSFVTFDKSCADIAGGGGTFFPSNDANFTTYSSFFN